jgi:hypothetical protein
MKCAVLLLALGFIWNSVVEARVAASPVWSITSPDHAQTFSYGTESRRQWSARGNPQHLVLFLDYTNDPFVDRSNPRQYDSFSFDFPKVKLQPDGRTFSCRAPDGRLVPVAISKSGFLGLREIELLPSAHLIVAMPHGSITLTLQIAG